VSLSLGAETIKVIQLLPRLVALSAISESHSSTGILYSFITGVMVSFFNADTHISASIIKNLLSKYQVSSQPHYYYLTSLEPYHRARGLSLLSILRHPGFPECVYPTGWCAWKKKLVIIAFAAS
jgi:hypothetical protein